MKTGIHSPNLVRILIIVTLVIPLAMGGFFPARVAPVYAAEPQSGIDCGCSATGAYMDPVAPAALTLTPATSPGGKYTVSTVYEYQTLSYLGVMLNGVEIISETGLPNNASWGFSPDEDRFAVYYIRNTLAGPQTIYHLYNLVGANRRVPVWEGSASGQDTEGVFSPHGLYFQYAAAGATSTWLEIVDAKTGDPIYSTTIIAAAPPGNGETRIASWGYSPDTSDRTFVYAYVDQQVVSSVSWNVVNLAAKLLVRNEMLVNGNTNQGIGPFWKFSRCGDAIGLVNTGVAPINIRVFATSDGTSLNYGGADVSTTGGLTLSNNLNYHYVTTQSGSTNVITNLVENTADASCDGGGGGGGTGPRRTGIDCGCSATGAYRNPVTPAALTLTPATSPGGKYTVSTVYEYQTLSYLGVMLNGTEIVSEIGLPSNASWGFSPDEDRFAVRYVRNTISGFETIYHLYNLVGTNRRNAVWEGSASGQDTEGVFSPHGLYFQYAASGATSTWLEIVDAKTGGPVYSTSFNAAAPPGGGKARIASWGYSPDTSDRTFVYAYVDQQVVSSVSWNVVNLAAKLLVRNEMLVNGNTYQAIGPFWKFSRCGDAIALVNTGVAPTNIRLFATHDGVPLNAGGLDITTAVNIALNNNLLTHYVTTESGNTALANNTADAACAAAPGLPALSSLTLNAASVMAGGVVQGTVTLNQAAPSGGVSVHLESDTGAAHVPASVTVASGFKVATFSVSTTDVPTETTALISAILGTTTNTAELTIIPPALASLTLSRYGIIAGDTVSATVTLRDPAPAGGAVVSLYRSGSFQTLTWVRVPEGETSVSFDVTADLYVGSPNGTLTATYAGAEKKVNLTILRASSVTATPAQVTGGRDAVAVTVGLPSPAPAGGIAVPLTADPAGIVDLPSSLIAETGQITGSITASTVALDEDTDVTVKAGVPDDTESPTATVRILATIPTALPGGPYVVLGGQPITLTGEGIDPRGESLTFAWDLDNNETFETAGDTAVYTNTAGRNREVPVGFQACNTSGLCGTALTFIRVRNPGQVWVSGPEPSQDIGMKNYEMGIPDGPTPAVVEGFGQVIDVVGGEGLIVALRADGTVWTMGDNFYGQLGNPHPSLPTGQLPNGQRAHSSVPVQAAISDVVAIASKGEHVVALKQDGTVWTWGSNRLGQLGNGTAGGNTHPTPTRVQGLSRVVSIAAGKWTSFALTGKGEVYGWGYGDAVFGRACDTILPCKITTIREAVALEVTSAWAIVLKRDGTVWFWGGYNPITMEDRLDLEQIEGLSGITAISAAGGHGSINGAGDALLALKNDGTVWGFGNNDHGQLGFNPWPPYPSYLRDYIGPVQIPGLAGTRALAAGESLQAALLPGGTVAGWGLNMAVAGEYWLPSPLAGLANVQAVAVGDDFRLAIIPGGGPGAIVYDNFDDNLINPSLWSTEQQGGPVPAEMNQRLEITLPADSAGAEFKAWYLSACQLRGDYDIQVDYQVLTWPNQNGVRIGLADNHANMQRISSGTQPYDYPGGPDLYLTTFDTADHVVGITLTSDLAGKLRLERVGDSLSSYYFTNGAWTLVASYSDPAYTQDTPFYIGSWSGDSVFADQEVKLAFDNLIVNSGELVCPSPGAPGLAITQVADQERVSTGDPISFTITITNSGDDTASSVTLTDPLPTYPELSWSVGGTDAASCAIAAGVLSCNLSDMVPGAVKTIRLTSPTQYIPGISGRGFCPTITSTATVMASNRPEPGSATASTTVLCPQVGVYAWADTPSVTAGDPISFTITVENYGEGIARDVLAETTLPENPGLSWSIASVVPASAAGNCYLSSGTPSYPHPELVCSSDHLAAGEMVTITITSPTTSASCGTLQALGVATCSNGGATKGKASHIIVNCTVAATVQPGEPATLTLLNSRGQIEFPAGLVTVPTTFTYAEQDAPSQALGSYALAGLSFTLDATDPAGNPVTSFLTGYTIRLNYQDSDWQSAGIADESLLNLAYWDTANGQWVNVLPCAGCSLDTAQNHLVAVLNHLTEFALLASTEATDATPPTTSVSLSPEANASGWHAGPVTVTLTASDSESGVHSTEYNLNGAGWTTYSSPFLVSSESTGSTVHNTVQYRSTDKAGNVEEIKSLTIQIDTTAPTVGAGVPLSGSAAQGGIKFGVKLADALSGPAGATLSIREADGASGKVIGHENLAAVYNSTSGNWELTQPFDTTQLPDGFYVLVATGKDVAGNEKTEIIPFSVRNWAVLELLPSTENNKAGRTMPVKFSLRVAQEVDPVQPFVYSEDLTITIYEAGKPTPVLQRSTFGSGSRDYRINAAQQTYITNFQTLKKPMQYTVEILRDALSIGKFGFQTTK